MDDEQGQLSGLQMGAMGVAAASPFAGLIGEKPIIHDPLQGAQGKKFRDVEALGRAARPGDVLMTSKPGGSMFKNFIMPAGRSQFYHAQPVTGRAHGEGYTFSAGDMAGNADSAAEALKFDHRIPDYMADADTFYPDVALLRPKTPLTKEQLQTLRTDYAERAMRPYDNEKALGTFFRDLFVPKVDALKNLRPETVCEGNVCSTMPAQAFHTATGRSVVPGKPAQDVFPTDFMRSPEFELVGSHVTPETAALEKSFARKAAPWALRAGLGAAAAAGTYAASEDPWGAAQVAAVPAGMVAAHKGIEDIMGSGAGRLQKMLPQKLQESLSTPQAWEHMPTHIDAHSALQGKGLRDAANRTVLSRFLTRRMPALAAGGALAYGGVKALEHGYDALSK
jgi:hypothetical protein